MAALLSEPSQGMASNTQQLKEVAMLCDQIQVPYDKFHDGNGLRVYPKQTQKQREARCRRALKKNGFLLRKSRFRNPGVFSVGLYCILDDRNRYVSGSGGNGYSLTLDNVEAWTQKLCS